MASRRTATAPCRGCDRFPARAPPDRCDRGVLTTPAAVPSASPRSRSRPSSGLRLRRAASYRHPSAAAIIAAGPHQTLAHDPRVDRLLVADRTSERSTSALTVSRQAVNGRIEPRPAAPGHAPDPLSSQPQSAVPASSGERARPAWDVSPSTVPWRGSTSSRRSVRADPAARRPSRRVGAADVLRSRLRRARRGAGIVEHLAHQRRACSTSGSAQTRRRRDMVGGLARSARVGSRRAGRFSALMKSRLPGVAGGDHRLAHHIASAIGKPKALRAVQATRSSRTSAVSASCLRGSQR